ncbi:hypothetical protein LIPSTDRAFT_165726 [Lipomyces starkeyi NRRL Y-11557]|uniref:Uncharacterized protein n=1 Tax=Lipomyces starkeyi NRRL Y-11557 TaxID=675824 RepID=A0A1E3PY99_LIPST|nr:hypothetical protein LIPSTDRAFT_165726 [Lipomyces starkeyi NRRL Y-11557]
MVVDHRFRGISRPSILDPNDPVDCRNNTIRLMYQPHLCLRSTAISTCDPLLSQYRYFVIISSFYLPDYRRLHTSVGAIGPYQTYSQLKPPLLPQANHIRRTIVIRFYLGQWLICLGESIYYKLRPCLERPYSKQLNFLLEKKGRFNSSCKNELSIKTTIITFFAWGLDVM